MKNYVISAADQLIIQSGTPFSCEIVHPGQSCEMNILLNLPRIMKSNAKVYLPVHLIPFLLYKRKQLIKNPISTISRALVSYFKSICFLSFMVQILRYNWCKQKNLLKKVDPFVPSSGGFISSFALLLESNTRAMEICLSIVPRFCETVVNLLKSRGKMINIPHGDVIVFSFVIAIIHYYYQHDPKSLKSTYYKVFEKIWGIN
ncbi:unnamed protein product [Paramecium sonneborni]|uniref:Uncharacterized protein n=1 Tax=Paramecium sonneborni TaxID=65129 RepID=A0A8S1R792_9CILI|nr:unnamed protein product [Paramecium sonneborni]